MYHIASSGLVRKMHRLVATEKLGPAEFRHIAGNIGRRAFEARKVSLIAARQAEAPETVETRWNGVETTNIARPGDWIATSLASGGKPMRDAAGNANVYAIRGETFDRLYERTTGENEFGGLYRAKSVVRAIRLEGGFDILAPWGERQTAESGYLILNGDEVYGNHRDTFEGAYEIIG